MLKKSIAALVCLAFVAGAAVLAPAAHAAQPTFTVGWSVYAGWNPYFAFNSLLIQSENFPQVAHRAACQGNTK